MLWQWDWAIRSLYLVTQNIPFSASEAQVIARRNSQYILLFILCASLDAFFYSVTLKDSIFLRQSPMFLPISIFIGPLFFSIKDQGSHPVLKLLQPLFNLR